MYRDPIVYNENVDVYSLLNFGLEVNWKRCLTSFHRAFSEINRSSEIVVRFTVVRLPTFPMDVFIWQIKWQTTTWTLSTLALAPRFLLPKPRHHNQNGATVHFPFFREILTKISLQMVTSKIRMIHRFTFPQPGGSKSSTGLGISKPTTLPYFEHSVRTSS